MQKFKPGTENLDNNDKSLNNQYKWVRVSFSLHSYKVILIKETLVKDSELLRLDQVRKNLNNDDLINKLFTF